MKITAKEYKRRIDIHIDYVKTNCMSDTEEKNLKILRLSKSVVYIKEIFFIRAMRDSLHKAIEENDPALDMNDLNTFKDILDNLNRYLLEHIPCINGLFGSVTNDTGLSGTEFNDTAIDAYNDFISTLMK